MLVLKLVAHRAVPIVYYRARPSRAINEDRKKRKRTRTRFNVTLYYYSALHTSIQPDTVSCLALHESAKKHEQPQRPADMAKVPKADDEITHAMSS